jgi:hypothetical protein
MLGEFALTCRDLVGWDDTRMWSLLCGTSTTSTRPAIALANMAAKASTAVRSLLEQRALPPGYSPSTSGLRRHSRPICVSTPAAPWRAS